ncbi:MAG: phospholipase D family protein [Pirellulaceae bacterium]|nr:phospholipase D family protein [Pirellulaceae bacterium]
MLADVEFLILPYASAEGRSLLHVLISEFGKPDWTHFRAAVAFAKASGSYVELFDAMRGFAQRGSRIDLTFGADKFSGDGSGSEYVAVQEVLARLGSEPTVHVYLYHENGRTFHPKIYLFSNDDRALVIVGSSNWTSGGFHNNIEANVILRLDLRTPAHRKCFDDIRNCCDNYWVEK